MTLPSPLTLSVPVRLTANRYLTREAYTYGGELQKLDETVWVLRRLCQDFDWIMKEADGTERNMHALLIAQVIDPGRRKNPALDRPLGPSDYYPEKVLKTAPADLARQALVWNNLFFAKVQRYRVSSKPLSSSEKPPQVRDWFTPEHAAAIAPYFKL